MTQTITQDSKSDKIKFEIRELKCLPRYIDSKLRGKRLTRHIFNLYRFGVIDDDIWSLDRYYLQLINDVLHNVRTGQPAWVFNTAQLKDVLRFEPYIDFEYDDEDEVIYIWR